MIVLGANLRKKRI